MNSTRSYVLAQQLLRSEIHRLPAPRTLRIARALVEAMREEGLSSGQRAYIASEAVWSYVRPCPGMSDRELGAALVAGARMHLVTYNLVILLEIALAERGEAAKGEAAG